MGARKGGRLRRPPLLRDWPARIADHLVIRAGAGSLKECSSAALYIEGPPQKAVPASFAREVAIAARNEVGRGVGQGYFAWHAGGCGF